jgi:hypothetical protein
MAAMHVIASPTAPPTSFSNGASRRDRVVVAVRSRALQAAESVGDVAVQMQSGTCEVYAANRGRFPFTFDECFDGVPHNPEQMAATQQDIFARIGLPLIENAVAGYNSSIIAYGPTGSGKTFSIFGPPGSLGSSQEGLIPRVCKELFHRLDTVAAGDTRGVPTRHSIRVAVIEVYVEVVYDLLAQRRQLKIRSEGSNKFGVPGMRWAEVGCYDDIEVLLREAELHKTFAATAIHDRSSRAHTLFYIELRASSVDVTRTSRVVLADLAGSERVKDARTDSGVGLQEATSINLSLLTLGTCIEAVVRTGRKATAPSSSSSSSAALDTCGEFRNSALTKLLRDYIGGNSRTAVLVTISPTTADVSNTLQALRFADRAKQLQSHAEINTRAVDPQLAKKVSKAFAAKRELLDEECRLETQVGLLANRMTQLEGTLAMLAHRAVSSDASIRAEADRQRRAIDASCRKFGGQLLLRRRHWTPPAKQWPRSTTPLPPADPCRRLTPPRRAVPGPLGFHYTATPLRTAKTSSGCVPSRAPWRPRRTTSWA